MTLIEIRDLIVDVLRDITVDLIDKCLMVIKGHGLKENIIIRSIPMLDSIGSSRKNHFTMISGDCVIGTTSNGREVLTKVTEKVKLGSPVSAGLPVTGV